MKYEPSRLFGPELLVLARCSMLAYCSVGLDLRSAIPAAAASGNGYWWPILTIACFLLDAGQIDVMLF